MLVIDWADFLEKGLPPVSEAAGSGQDVPINNFVKNYTSMTIGVFDGVHRGHRALIERIVSHNIVSSSADCCIPAVITFKENHKNAEAGNIQSFREKLEIFEQLGVKLAIVIDFTESFRRMKGIEFLEILLKHGNIGYFAVGSGFRCGYQLDTDAQAIREFFVSRNIQAEIVPEVTEGSLPVSSSRIRAAIANGDFEFAELMLGRPVPDGCPPVRQKLTAQQNSEMRNFVKRR